MIEDAPDTEDQKEEECLQEVLREISQHAIIETEHRQTIRVLGR